MKKFDLNKYIPFVVFATIITIWQIVCSKGLVSAYILPAPFDIVKAFIFDINSLLINAMYSLASAGLGLVLAVVIGVILSVLMDSNKTINSIVSPLVVFSQTIPTIAIAPILIIWFGYGLLPKVLLVFLTCSFPIIMGMLTGLKDIDKDAVIMFKTFGATKWDLYKQLKLPSSLSSFFSSLKIAASYAIISAVVAEWLGGNNGLGVYMTRVRKSFSMDKMFAAIIFISIITTLLVQLIKLIERKYMPWSIYE